MGIDYYNNNIADEYYLHYTKSWYWKKGQWKRIKKFLDNMYKISILDIGCGSGQLGQMILENYNCEYKGFDFSDKRIEIAKKNNPRHKDKFYVGDAYDKKSYPYYYNIAIITEVLEHTDDFKILNNIGKFVQVILSVPTFEDKAHLRIFKSQDEIINRYREYIKFKYIILENRIWICVGQKI